MENKIEFIKTREIDFHKLVSEAGKDNPDVNNYDAFCILEKQGFKFTERQFSELFFNRASGRSISQLYHKMITAINYLNNQKDDELILSHTIKFGFDHGNDTCQGTKYQMTVFNDFFVEKLKDLYRFEFDTQKMEVTIFKNLL